MATSLLVVTPSPSFGEQIRKPLEENGAYHVHVVSSKAAAIVRADEESCRLAFLDLDLGETWVEEVGQSLRTVIPDIKLFLLAGDETLPTFESLRPWTFIRKPFDLAEMLKIIGQQVAAPNGLTPKEAAARDMLWLTDVNKAAQHLTRLTLESSSQAALITRENEVWAYAGQLSQMAAQEIARALARNWDAGKGGDLLRFVRLETTKAEHMLYATQLVEGMLLAMVFDAETPFGTIRTQASQLATSLSEGEVPEEAGTVADDGLDAIVTPIGEFEDDDEGMDMPPISEILKDIPVPDPRASIAQARVQAPETPAVMQQVDVAPTPVVAAQAPTPSPIAAQPAPATQPTSVEQPPAAIPQPVAEAPAPAPEAVATPVKPVDPDTTRPSIFANETAMPIRMGATTAADTMPSAHASETEARPVTPVSSTDETVASHPQSRPEMPVRAPLPGELDETRPSASTEIAAGELSLGAIVMEPISAGVYHLSYACLLIPRFAHHFLTGDVADKLSEWIPIICVAFGWRLEHLAVRPEYLQWVVNVAPATSPGYVMRVIRQQLSDKIFAAFPRLKRENPSGDFWAPGYLIMGGIQPHPPQLVKDYIRQIRQRQGLEKPVGADKARR